jgi:hypothetical protein
VEFSDNKLTGNAGLVHLGRFAKKLGVQDILERRLSISRGKNATYDVPLLLTMLEPVPNSVESLRMAVKG